MSLLKVPQPVKDVFDAFPKHQFPATRQLTAAEKQQLEARRYTYGQAPLPTAQTHFTLCVYNVFTNEDNLVLATDPLCLAAQLSLAARNGISLPKLNNDHTDKARNAVFTASHHASPEGHLPLYIEEDPLRKSRRVVRDCVSLHETLRSRVDSSTELMLVTLVDSVVYDAWMTAVLLDSDEAVQSELYQFQQTEGHALINKVGLQPMFAQLVKRNGFHLRNRQIADIIETRWPFSLWWRKTKGVEAERTRNYRELEHALDSIAAILAKRGSHFFSNEERPGLLDVELAAFVVLMERFLGRTPVAEALARHPGLIAHAASVLKACS